MGGRHTYTYPPLGGHAATDAGTSKSAAAVSTASADLCMHPAIRIVLARISEHLSERWTLRRAASLVGHNPSYLCWLFRRETGMNFREWVEACRIERSERLLVETRKLIGDIAFEVGYSDSTFERAFKRRNGVSPQKFRSCYRRPLGDRPRGAAMNAAGRALEQLE